ncbi:MAG: GrpB family protein [Tumebacillaceae bacterium]
MTLRTPFGYRIPQKEAKRYGDLKEQLAGQFEYDIDSYIAGKHGLILELEEAALRWAVANR